MTKLKGLWKVIYSNASRHCRDIEMCVWSQKARKVFCRLPLYNGACACFFIHFQSGYL